MSPTEMVSATYETAKSFIASQITTGEPELPMAGSRLEDGNTLTQEQMDALTFCAGLCPDCPMRSRVGTEEAHVIVKSGREFSVVDVNENETRANRITRGVQTFIYKLVGLEEVKSALLSCEGPTEHGNSLYRFLGRKTCGAIAQVSEGGKRNNRTYKN